VSIRLAASGAFLYRPDATAGLPSDAESWYNGYMKKKTFLCAVLVVGLAAVAQAGSFLVHVRMPDNSVVTFELPSVPTPDSNGMYRLHNKEGGDLIVHASNVWIEEKSTKGKAKAKK